MLWEVTHWQSMLACIIAAVMHLLRCKPYSQTSKPSDSCWHSLCLIANSHVLSMSALQGSHPFTSSTRPETTAGTTAWPPYKLWPMQSRMTILLAISVCTSWASRVSLCKHHLHSCTVYFSILSENNIYSSASIQQMHMHHSKLRHCQLQISTQVTQVRGRPLHQHRECISRANGVNLCPPPPYPLAPPDTSLLSTDPAAYVVPLSSNSCLCLDSNTSTTKMLLKQPVQVCQ